VGFAAVFVPLVALGVRRVLREPTAAIVLLPWCFGPPLLAFLLSLVSHVTYQARYGGAALPAFAVLLALGTVSLNRRPWHWGMVAAVLICFVWSLTNYYVDPRYAKEDVRGTVAHIEAARQKGAPVAVIGQVDDAVAFYGPALHVVKVESCLESAGHQSLPRALDNGRPLWLVVGRDWDGQAPGCLERLARSHAAVDRQHFPGVDLWFFRPVGVNDADRGAVPPTARMQ